MPNTQEAECANIKSQARAAQRMYDNRASTYDSSWHPSFAVEVIRFADPQPGYSVLDLACGTGLVTIAAAQAVGPTGMVVEIDVSNGMLEKARLKVQQHCLRNVEIYNGDITRINDVEAIEHRKFDLITCASALVLLTDDDRVRSVKEWTQWLKPGGALVVDVPTPSNHVVGRLLARTAKKLGLEFPGQRDWIKDQSSLRDFLQDAGLEVEKIIPVEQSGAGTRWFASDDADACLEKELQADHAKALRPENANEEMVREIFRMEWKAAAVDDRLKLEDCVWLAIGRKLHLSDPQTRAGTVVPR